MKRILIIILLSIWVLSTGYSQSKKAVISAAENAFMQKDYYSALIYYTDASEFDTTNYEVQYKIAESARLFDAYVLAESKYQNVIENDDSDMYPLSSFWLAEVKQKLGKYNEAKGLYELYVSEHDGDDAYYSNKAKKEIKAAEWALEMEEYPDESITLTKLGDEINTQYSEFGAVEHNDVLHFSSLKYIDPEGKSKPSKLISKILTSDDNSSVSLLESGSDNNSIHAAHTAYSVDGTKLYYTICQYLNGADIQCKLYVRNVTAEGKLGTSEMLPESVNANGATNTQPNVAFVPALNKEVLFFSSDRQGGEGLMDIYYVTIEGDNRYSEAINLADINTAENEITPFFHTGTDALYFSSDGYQRIGGYDIYKSQYTSEGYQAPALLGIPTNSSFNDVYFTLSEDGRKAYFSSNRLDSKFIDTGNEACCYDIYKADIAEVILNLNALTFDKRNSKDLKDVTVKIIDSNLDTIVAEMTNGEGNDHMFELDRDKDYIIIGQREGYKSDTIQYSTKRLSKSQDILKKLFLESIMVPHTFEVYDKGTGEKLDSVSVKIIDLSDGSIKDTTLLTDGNTLEHLLSPGKTYRIEVSKDGYKTNTFTIDTDKDDLSEINKKILLEKKDLNIYLPLTLFFDNDRPNRRTYVPYTKLTYTETYNPYYARKDLFKTKVGITLSGENRIVQEQSMEDFFEFDVRGGFEKMTLFLSALEEKLNSGYSFEIQIKGYASPRSTKAYNKILSQRRVMSVMNELNKYKSGLLDQFITSGKLIITDISFGEEQAASNVSSSLRNEELSIYSIEASRERRVEIIKIRSLFE